MDTSLVNMILLTLGVMAVAIFAVTLLINFSSSKTLLLESTDHVVETTSKFATVEYQPYDDVEIRGSDARYIVEKYGADKSDYSTSKGMFFVSVTPKSDRSFPSESGIIVINAFRECCSIGKHTDTTNNELISSQVAKRLPATYIDAQARYHSYLLVKSNGTSDTIVLNGKTYCVPTNYKIGSCTDSLAEISGIWLVEY